MELKDLKHPEKNVRKHPEAQIDAYVESLKLFGQIRPIVCDEQRLILIGNGMVMAMRRAGWTEAEVHIREGLTEAQKKSLMLADNRIFEMGIDDHEAIHVFLQEMEDLDIPGFDRAVVDRMLASQEQIEQSIQSYGSPGEGETKSGKPPVPPTRDETPQETSRPQIQCPHCGAKVWAE